VGAAFGVAGTRWYQHHAATAPAAKRQKALSQTHESAAQSADQNGQWDPLQEMREVRSQIDQAFQRSFDRLQKTAPASLVSESSYSSTMDVESLKDRFEVHAYLPDAKASDAQVQLHGNQLSVELTGKAADTAKARNQEVQTTEWGRYDQVVQLPGKVQADKMRVIRKDHELIITVPRAS